MQHNEMADGDVFADVASEYLRRYGAPSHLEYWCLTDIDRVIVAA